MSADEMPLFPVATNVHLPVRVGAPDNLSSATLLTTRMRHVMQRGASGLRLVHANWFNDGGRDRPGPDPIRVSVTLEGRSGSATVTFGGAPSVVIAPGDAVLSDPVALGLPAGGGFFSSTVVSVGRGGRIPLGSQTSAPDGEWVGRPGATAHGYGPWQLLGSPDSGPPAHTLLVTGDSNAVGFGDRRGGACHHGWVQRAFGHRLPTVNLAVSGATASGTVSAESRHRRDVLLRWVRPTLALTALGTNDLQQGGPDLRVMQHVLTAHWQELVERGTEVVACTLPPVSTSSDGWRTTNGQRPTPGWEVREQVNDWIRSVPAPLSGVLDLAAVLAASSDSRRWAAGLTADGVHPNPGGHSAAAELAASWAASHLPTF